MPAVGSSDDGVAILAGRNIGVCFNGERGERLEPIVLCRERCVEVDRDILTVHLRQ